MGIMKGLVAEGKSILFISHKLNEIMKIADRCTVLRRGKNMGVVKTKNTTIAKLSKMMVGRDIEFVVNKEPAKPQETVLKVENLHVISPLSKKHVVNDVSFTVRKGEIVCLAGIEGNGQSDLIYALTGLMPIHSGSIYLNNIDISKKIFVFATITA